MSNAMKEVLLTAGLMNSKEVAHALGVSERTVIRWRCNRVNLPFSMIGGQARYEPDHVRAFKARTRIDVAGFPISSHSDSHAA